MANGGASLRQTGEDARRSTSSMLFNAPSGFKARILSGLERYG
jgi:hypothetical protein